VLIGVVNGVGVAYLRIPSMVMTLAVNAVAQGLMVVHTGGFSPQDSSSPAMRYIATGDSLLGVPNALVVDRRGRRDRVPAHAHVVRAHRLRSATANAPPTCRARARRRS
jgi:ABC-type xylose transport system permease subunit